MGGRGLKRSAAVLLLVLIGPSGSWAQGSVQECPAGPGAAPCREQRLRAAEADLAAVRRALPEAIDRRDGNLTEEDRRQWKADLETVLASWLAFRDARCDPALLAFEGARPDAAAESLACKARQTVVIASDLKVRYDIDPQATPRRSIDSLRRPETRAGSPEDRGPCAKAPPKDCDYCGLNACWTRVLRKADGTLNATWGQALRAVRARSALPEAARETWAGKLRAAQRAWAAWKDQTCALEGFETPNRFAHSLYALQKAPCLHEETRARTRVLRATYRLP